MLKTIHIEDRGLYVSCEYSGPFWIHCLMDIVKNLSEFCKAYGQKAALIDVSKSFGGSKGFDQYYLRKIVSGIKEQEISIAILGRPNQVTPDLSWENILKEGALRIKLFTNVRRAMEWLQSYHTYVQEAQPGIRDDELSRQFIRRQIDDRRGKISVGRSPARLRRKEDPGIPG